MNALKTKKTARFLAIMVALLVAVVAAGLWGFISFVYAEEVPTAPYTLETGYLDFAYGAEVLPDHTATRPESKLWWNDGFWWASMWNDILDEYHIYRLDWGSQNWQDTGVALDDRAGSRSDVLWDEASQKLYVASYLKKDNPSEVNTPDNWARLYRLTYHEATESYTLDPGFPVTEINVDRTNSLVLDKDSDGKLWATYVSRPQGAGSDIYQVYVNSSTGDDEIWQTPFSLYDLFPEEASVAVDDISSIVSFNNTVGVMWTNQLSGTLHFALHDPAQPMESGWTTETIAITGQIDDHLSLKANSAGQLFAAIKTSYEISDTGQPLIAMVTRDTGGQYAFHEYSSAEDNDTRPTVLVDETNDQVYVFVTGKPGGSMICYKTADITTPLSSMSFPAGDCGTNFIADPTYDRFDSATTSKHSVTDLTGLVVLASDDHNGNVYGHNVIGDPPPVITNRSPGAGEADVAPDSVVQATFSKNIDPATVDGTSFLLESSSGFVGGSVTYDSSTRTATFAPTAPLQAGTIYTATVTNAVQDMGGQALFETETWTFNTGSASVAFSSANYSVNEGAGTATISVTLNAPASGQVTVDYSVSDGTATATSDYSADPGTLTFAAGETVKTFDVTIQNDVIDEPNETVNLTLSNAVNADLGMLSTATLTIVDNDGTPTVQFEPTSINTNEGAGTKSVTVGLSHPSGTQVTVDYATTDGTATAGSDYLATSNTLTFAPGETSKTFSVSLIDDAIDEPDETVVLTLSNPTNAALGIPGNAATLTIEDNDPLVSVAFGAATYTVDEAAGTATINVTLSGTSAFNVSVAYETALGTATADSDYTPISGTLSFAPGETSKTFTVPVLNDALNEPDETVNLTLSNPTNAALGTPSSATLTITDDDPAPTVEFSVADYTVSEGAASVTIRVDLSAQSGQTAAVDYATSDGSATAGSDYVATSGTLDFEAGETSKTFTVTILDDDLVEGDETVNLTLSNPDDVTLGTLSTATLTIEDDDGNLLFMPFIVKP